ncbi:MAG: hypothetical protein AB1391_03150 [Candidatus Micrarchaeota archaeon]
MRTKRGFLFTFDSLLALLLLAEIMIIVISQNYSDITNTNSLYLQSFSMSFMTSLEKSGLLAQSISKPYEIRRAINHLPPNICARITITNSSNNTVFEAQKEACSQIRTYYTTYRTFYTNAELYFAKSQMWFK